MDYRDAETHLKTGVEREEEKNRGGERGEKKGGGESRENYFSFRFRVKQDWALKSINAAYDSWVQSNHIPQNYEDSCCLKRKEKKLSNIMCIRQSILIPQHLHFVYKVL